MNVTMECPKCKETELVFDCETISDDYQSWQECYLTDKRDCECLITDKQQEEMEEIAAVYYSDQMYEVDV